MPSSRLKLVKVAPPSAAASSSPFCSKKHRSCAFVAGKNNTGFECVGDEYFKFSVGSGAASQLPPPPHRLIPLPPQLHHFASRTNWLVHYRRWLKNSKAVWLQRLHRQHSILNFFVADARRVRREPSRSSLARKAAPKQKLKNATLEAYGARAGTFKVSRFSAAMDSSQKQLFHGQER